MGKRKKKKHYTMQMEQMNNKPTQNAHRVTMPQIVAMTIFSLVLLAVGVFIAATFGNFSMSPKGNKQDSFVTTTVGLAQAKQSEVVDLKNGDTFNLTAGIVQKEINGQTVKMLAYNGSIPGPVIKVPQGAAITILFKNDTDVDTALHSHGVRLDNAFDGVVDVTQKTIKPGESFTYKVKFPDAGIFWYHPHVREDYAQTLGLYGNYIVTPTDANYWSPVNQEKAVFLSDISIQNGQIAPFSTTAVDHTLMGRFGNQILVNGETNYTQTVQKGEVVRYYLTNSASTRVFNFSIKGAKMKLVGTDSGKYEKETFVDSVVISPSERSVVDVFFDTSGEYKLIHTTPQKTYELGSITVSDTPIATSYANEFATLRTNTDVQGSIASLQSLFDKPDDKSLDLTLAMNDMNSQGSGNGSGMNMQHDMGSMNTGSQENSMQMGQKDTDKIEWEDVMASMNASSTKKTLTWKLVDQETKKENMDINWQFSKGDKVKIKLFNDPKSPHPMQHPIHIHGQRFLVLSTNGIKNTNLVYKDTVLVQKGDTVEILVDMSNPGKWVLHCHIPEHMEAGMMSTFKVI